VKQGGIEQAAPFFHRFSNGNVKKYFAILKKMCIFASISFNNFSLFNFFEHN